MQSEAKRGSIESYFIYLTFLKLLINSHPVYKQFFIESRQNRKRLSDGTGLKGRYETLSPMPKILQNFVENNSGVTYDEDLN